jgi:hypothetical protein
VATSIAVALASGPAFAVGTITGLSANPTSIRAGTSVDLTVEGTGTCDLTVLFGDGESVTFNNAAMPRAVAHVYQSPGTFSASATAPDCPSGGLPEVKITVRFRIGQHENLDAKDVVRLNPMITRAFGWGIEPGNGLFVGGSRFGDQEGTVWIVGDNEQYKALEIENWFDDAAGGIVPADVHDICVTGIQIETADGRLSGVFPVSVPMAVKPLPHEDVTLLACGDDGDDNNCLGQSTDTEDIFSCALAWHIPFGSLANLFSSLGGYSEGDGSVPPSLYGTHRNCWGSAGDDSDTDRFQISLRNGWVLDSAQFVSRIVTGDQDEGSTTPPSGTLPAGFVEGASSWEPEIGWEVSPNDTIAYGMTVFIRGPACSSHK